MKIAFYMVLVCILFVRCEEVYNPNIKSDDRVLNVDGLLTDKPESFMVNLQSALPFDSFGTGLKQSGASVFVTDGLSHIYPFTEKTNGCYFSDTALLSTKPGQKYRLTINSPDGNKYESSFQELIPNKVIDKIYGQITDKSFMWKNQNGEYIYVNNTGIESFLDIITTSEQSSYFKFNINLLIEYTYLDGPSPEPEKKTKYYAWGRWKINDNVNLAETRLQNGNQEIIAHPLPFVPTEKSWYSLEPGLWKINYQVIHWILIIEKYRLNEESFGYYSRINEQLSAEGKIFDPMASQINGNMHCVSNPAKLVLGNFEVSAKETIYYLLTPDWTSKLVSFKKTADLTNIPDEGAVEFRNLPEWWIR